MPVVSEPATLTGYEWACEIANDTLRSVYCAACQIEKTAHMVFTREELERAAANKQAIQAEMRRRGLAT